MKGIIIWLIVLTLMVVPMFIYILTFLLQFAGSFGR